MKTAAFASLCSGVLLATMAAAPAAIVYSEDFNTDSTANWVVNDSGLSDIRVDFFYDYSAIGVPPAPNGTGTRGLVMSANNSGGVFSGFSVSPKNQSFTGDFILTFDLWANYVGPLDTGGSGTTQLSTYGIGTAGSTAIWPAGTDKENIFFATTLDGGSSSDYRVYTSASPTSYPNGSPVYFAPSTNGSDPYYSVFGGESAPAAQQALYPSQTGTTPAGVIGFAWRQVEIRSAGGVVTWSIDGLPIAQIDLDTVTLNGSNIFFGHSDTNSTSSIDPNASVLNVTIIDNIVVRTRDIPEPASLALGALAAGGLFLRRRRA